MTLKDKETIQRMLGKIEGVAFVAWHRGLCGRTQKEIHGGRQ